jgi:hypothetical protein
MLAKPEVVALTESINKLTGTSGNGPAAAFRNKSDAWDKEELLKSNPTRSDLSEKP